MSEGNLEVKWDVHKIFAQGSASENTIPRDDIS